MPKKNEPLPKEFVITEEQADAVNKAFQTFKDLFKQYPLVSLKNVTDKECDITVSIEWKPQDFN